MWVCNNHDTHTHWYNELHSLGKHDGDVAQTHTHTGYWNPLRHVAASVNDGEAGPWSPHLSITLFSSLSPHRIIQTHTHVQTVRLHIAFLHTCSDTGSGDMSQTFTKLPPGFDWWAATDLPPVSYTYNLICGGPHGGSCIETELIEAVKLSFFLSPPQVTSYPLGSFIAPY